jgi:hypothetical protein
LGSWEMISRSQVVFWCRLLFLWSVYVCVAYALMSYRNLGNFADRHLLSSTSFFFWGGGGGHMD